MSLYVRDCVVAIGRASTRKSREENINTSIAGYKQNNSSQRRVSGSDGGDGGSGLTFRHGYRSEAKSSSQLVGTWYRHKLFTSGGNRIDKAPPLRGASHYGIPVQKPLEPFRTSRVGSVDLLSSQTGPGEGGGG